MLLSYPTDSYECVPPKMFTHPLFSSEKPCKKSGFGRDDVGHHSSSEKKSRLELGCSNRPKALKKGLSGPKHRGQGWAGNSPCVINHLISSSSCLSVRQGSNPQEGLIGGVIGWIPCCHLTLWGLVRFDEGRRGLGGIKSSTGQNSPQFPLIPPSTPLGRGLTEQALRFFFSKGQPLWGLILCNPCLHFLFG
jgi:hypothetical protein